MSFVRYKLFGRKEYAYKVTAYWDPVRKRPCQKTEYLGLVVDKKNRIFKKKEGISKKEKLVLDFGDTYLLHQFLRGKKILGLVRRIFGDRNDDLLALICYRLCYRSAMVYANIWYEGNVARFLFKNADLSSQRVSEFLKIMGDESLQRGFFREYISTFTESREGVVIDTTALPNQIRFPPSAWGYHDEQIDTQIKFILVVDRKTSLPLFFRYCPGNIVDVSSLKTTVKELEKHGVREYSLFLDAGFYSEENIKELYGEELPFLTRLPSSRRLYKELIQEEVKDIEKLQNAVKYGKRALYVKQKKIDLFGRKAYAHIVLDPERKGRETRKLLLELMEEGVDKSEAEYKLMKKGVMILVSSFEIKKEEAIPLYYLRQRAEQLFGFAKDDLKLIPLRVHKEETLRGFLFIMFTTLAIFALLKKDLGEDYTVEEALLTLRNLKCKVYDDEIVVLEASKQQKEIFDKLEILVPKSLGI